MIILAILVTALAVTALASLKATKIYEAQGRIALLRDTTPVIGSHDSDASNEDWDYTVSLATQVNIIQSDNLALEVAKRLHWGEAPATAANNIADVPAALSPAQERALIAQVRGGLHVEVLTGTRIIEIRYDSSNPSLAADVVNATIATYIEDSYRSKVDNSMRSSEFLQQQLESMRVKMEAAQEKLVRYQKDNDILAVGSGFTEAVSAGQIAFFAVAMAATFIFPSNSSASAGSKSDRPDLKRTVSLRWPLTAALAGSMVGTAIVAASPGNAIRLAALHNPPFDPVYFVRRVPILVAASLLISARSPMLLAILMGGGIASAGTLPQLASRSLIKEGRSRLQGDARSGLQINSPRTWLIFFAGSLIVLAACVAPSAYGRIFMGRTQMVPQFFLSLATVTFGVLLGLAWPATRRATAILLVAVAAVSSAWQTTRALRQLPAARDYAHQFDRRQLDLRQPEQRDYALHTRSAVVMDRLRSTTLILSDGAGPDANDWTNRCEADYYDLPSVRTTK
jgi:capsular polysaccharide biosynthesis protein